MSQLTIIGTLLLAVIVIAGVCIKISLKKKIKNIDGLFEVKQ